MKVRNGFVSNSSSSSFVIAKAYLTEQQIDDLQLFCQQPIGPYHDSWEVNTDKYNISGYTSMNNNGSDEGGLEYWMKNHGFPMEAITWDHN